jgi:hypothetical protein
VLVISMKSGVAPSRETRLTPQSRPHDTPTHPPTHTHTHIYAHAHAHPPTHTHTHTYTKIKIQGAPYLLRESAVKYENVFPQREIGRQSWAAPARCAAQGIA